MIDESYFLFNILNLKKEVAANKSITDNPIYTQAGTGTGSPAA
jgi:hypothetical protein